MCKKSCGFEKNNTKQGGREDKRTPVMSEWKGNCRDAY